jgi:hypothetical protein
LAGVTIVMPAQRPAPGVKWRVLPLTRQSAPLLTAAAKMGASRALMHCSAAFTSSGPGPGVNSGGAFTRNVLSGDRIAGRLRRIVRTSLSRIWRETTIVSSPRACRARIKAGGPGL